MFNDLSRLAFLLSHKSLSSVSLRKLTAIQSILGVVLARLSHEKTMNPIFCTFFSRPFRSRRREVHNANLQQTSKHVYNSVSSLVSLRPCGMLLTRKQIFCSHWKTSSTEKYSMSLTCPLGISDIFPSCATPSDAARGEYVPHLLGPGQSSLNNNNKIQLYYNLSK